MDSPIRLFILSDNRLFREALARIFSKKTGIETIGSRECGPEAVEEVAGSDADVLLLDSAALLGSDLARVRSREGKNVKVVMVAMKDDEELFLEVVRQGACGYVPKDASAMELVNAVRAVAQGEAVCPPHLCKRLFDVVAQHWAETAAQPVRVGRALTRREEQLIPMIDRGLTNKEIAAQLNLSEKTIKNHVHRILRKVGAENRFSVAAACRSSRNSGRENSSLASLRPS
jgi:DNA-binding NarL/FixJ family response regulator